ncbi:hypothetical protein Bca101_082594 [Brassica carinata]
MALLWSTSLQGVLGVITPLGMTGTSDMCSLKLQDCLVILHSGVLLVTLFSFLFDCILETPISHDLPLLLDVSRLVSFSREVVVKLVMEIPRRFRGVAFLTSKEALCHSRVWGNVVRLSVSAVYDEYQRGKTQKRRPFYVPPPQLARTTPKATSFSSNFPGDAEAAPNQDLEAGVHWRLLGEVFFLCTQVGAYERMAGEEDQPLESHGGVSPLSASIRRRRPASGRTYASSNTRITVLDDRSKIEEMEIRK